MSNTKTKWNGLSYPAVGDAGWGDTLNDLFEVVDDINAGMKVSVTDPNSVLNTTVDINSGWYGYYGSQDFYAGASSQSDASWSAGGIFCVYVDSQGTLVLDETSYPDSVIQLARVTTDSTGIITSVVDDRVPLTLTPYASGGGAVFSVNGKVGIVVLSTADIAASTDKNYLTDAEKTVLGNTSGSNTGDQDLSGLALKINVLELDNTTPFTPDADYEPATKKYVDDNGGGAVDSVNGETGTVVLDTGDLLEVTDKNYVTDAEKTVIGNTSNTNTGDQTISDATISLTDITTNDVSTSKHGFAPKGDGSTSKFLNAAGAYSVPGGSGAVDSVNGQTGTVVLDTGDLLEVTDKNYVTDAEKTVIGNTSNTNTGDQDLSSYATITGEETLTNKTLTSPVINSPTGISKGDVGLGNVANVDTTNATNITSGTIASSVLPPVALTSVQVAASELAMLALTTEEGDVVVRSDENKSYMHNGGSAGTMADFTELMTPTDSVLSVNSKTGTVSLDADDIAATTDKNYVTDAEKTVIGNTSNTNTGDQDLSGLALKTNVLELDNTTAFTPDADYEPATKKYVDENAGSGSIALAQAYSWFIS